ITKAADNGMLLSGNNNKIEMMVFNDNQDTGLQISRYNTSAATIAEWPSNNLVLNCTSKNNCDDKTMENADGFAAKLTCGEGNVFDGCMAYNNSDDGWDLFAKAETGPIGVVTIKNSIAFRNGFTEFGEGYGDCDGNGFKLGGSGIGSAHIVENCLAFENLHCGFTDNNNPKLGTIRNSTAVNNNGEGTGKPNFSCYRCTDDGCDFENLMSYYDSSVFMSDSKLAGGASNDKYVGTYTNGVYYNSGYYKVDAKTNVTNGAKIGTKYEGPSASDFVSMAKAPVQGTDFHTAWRNADGSLNTGGLYETTGTYKSMGYHFDGSSVTPPTTTATTTTTKPTETTTTTKKPDTPVVSGGYTHNFTLNGTNSSFYTITGNLSTGKGTVNYGDLTLTQCLKMETATSVSFNADNAGTLTLVFVEPSATIKVDGTKYTATNGIVTVDLSAGSHSITKADSANLFYINYSVESSSSTETGLKGDANCDGSVDIADVVSIAAYVGDSANNTLKAQGIINADVQGNNGINATDALTVQQYLANIITSL
ncbi:MAG: dockerin type I domain-containing protein, partial [Oscillospiraceae bacterium]|nr:dockerin type I domain-containing protein [Oscillospiraceae bacterium]